MQTPTGWKRKFILLFKSEKRLGAKQITQHFAQKDFTSMKAKRITTASEFGSEVNLSNFSIPDTSVPSDYEPKRVKDLTAHLTRLQHEFIGQSELCFYHASLIVLLRRGYKVQQNFAKFESLWHTEFDFLAQQLSLRWLVSASDTFVDFSPSPTRQAIFMNVATLVNTLKVYETKLDLLGNPEALLPDKVNTHRKNHLSLYEGLHYFRLGTDDTLHNMRQRYEKFQSVDDFATKFLLIVFDRLQQSPSAFNLIMNLHTDEKSQWWRTPK